MIITDPLGNFLAALVLTVAPAVFPAGRDDTPIVGGISKLSGLGEVRN